ncbi:right-handed parallel beta-helix repeat-containing protein [Candidatus Dependentiae bacterium]|nr:right-handed parallel beta-helix repeat-containing protein [Candidatus Dependentiae bacterium]
MNCFSLVMLMISHVIVAQGDRVGSRLKKNRLRGDSRSYGHESKKGASQSPTLKGIHYIYKKDIGVKGFVIDKPGVYRLAEDINFAPASDKNHAISIRASNVILDLNSKRLKQSNDKKNNIGIMVCQAQRAVVIRNGFIEGFGALGMWVSKASREISFDSIDVLSCGSRGHAPYSSQDGLQSSSRGFFAGGLGLGGLEDPSERLSSIEIRNCRFLDVVSTQEAAFDPMTGENSGIIAVGIGGAAVDGLVVENCTCDTISSSKSTARGLTITDGGTVEIAGHRSSSIAHNQGGSGILLYGINSGFVVNSYVDRVRDTGGVVFIQRGSIGLGVVSSSDIAIQSCFVTQVNNMSDIGIAHGIEVRSSTNVSVLESQVFDCGAEALAVSVAGISYSASVDTGTAISIIRCISNGNSSIFGNAYGFNVEPFQLQYDLNGPIIDNGIPQGVVLDGCTAESNSTAGFRFRNASSSSILNSITKNNVHFGILLEATGTAQFKACSIENNVIETNGTGGFDAGVQDYYPIQNMYIGNKAFNNLVNYAGIPSSSPLVTWVIPTQKPLGDITQKFANLDAQSH